jgi:hypothetical protein
VTLDWARFECRAARFRFEFDMRVEMIRFDPLPSPTPEDGESHELAMSATAIDGVRLEVEEPGGPPPGDTTGVPPPPPPEPPPGPPPIDSTGVVPEG